MATQVRGVSLLFCLIICTSAFSLAAGNLYRELKLTWGDGRSKILGDVLQATLDKSSGSGFESKDEYLYVKMDMQIKLVRGNSAGTVTTYYLSSKGANHDEIDFEFLGNLSGDPYTVHTNVFCNGVGKREQQFRLSFDPTSDFHTYSIYWTPLHILFLVDGKPIREYKNLEKKGICFPKFRPMKLYSSIWNADDWATRGGLVKTDWSKGPFKAYYKNYGVANACIWRGKYSMCRTNYKYLPYNKNPWLWESLSQANKGTMRWMKYKYMVYDYCKDYKRFPSGFPKECYLNEN